MKITAFAGSNSSKSINKQLVSYTCSLIQDATINLLDLNDYEMPIFSVDRESKDGYPEQAKSFLDCIKNADGLIISLAEHNRTYSAAFKNIFDWISRIDKKPFQNNPMLLLSTSTGAYGGGNVMETATKFFPQFGADIVDTFSLPKFAENFDPEKGITNEEYHTSLITKVDHFRKYLLKQQ